MRFDIERKIRDPDHPDVAASLNSLANARHSGARGGESPEEAHPLAGILPKFSDWGQGAIGEAIEAASAGQFRRLHKEALDDGSILDDIRNAS